MITIASAAIPTYLALLKVSVGSEGIHGRAWISIPILMLPPVCFLVAASLFAIGYFPQRKRMLLDDLPSVVAALEGIARHRYRFARWGFAAFVVGTVGSIGLFLFASGV
jgi:hypothetical protein